MMRSIKQRIMQIHEDCGLYLYSLYDILLSVLITIGVCAWIAFVGFIVLSGYTPYEGF